MQRNAGLYLKSERWPKWDVKEFCDVKNHLPHGRSIIAAGQCYLTDEKEDLTEPGKPYGLVARYTWRNHYLDLRRRLEKLGEFIKQEYRASCLVYANGPVAEKPIAQRSGIGYYGKHSIIINKTFGSWIVLGEVITELEIEPDSPIDIDCGQCQACLDACPTGAIIKPYVIDRRKCIQALTNWYGIIPAEIRRVWGKRFYGCTTCQDACPKNREVKPRSATTQLGYVGSCVPLLEILEMDEARYRAKYANNQITTDWINFKAMQRNALLCLGYIKDKTTLPVLQRFAKEGDEVHAQTASWAIQSLLDG